MPSFLTRSIIRFAVRRLAPAVSGALASGLALAHPGADAGAHHSVLATLGRSVLKSLPDSAQWLAIAGVALWGGVTLLAIGAVAYAAARARRDSQETRARA